VASPCDDSRRVRPVVAVLIELHRALANLTKT